MAWLVAAVIVGGLIWRDLKRRRAPVVGDGSGSSIVAATPDASVAPIDAAVVADASDVDAVVVERDVDAAPVAPLYTVTEALEDLQSGPLEFIGTGEWFGNFSIHGCAYRNARVIVAYEYCTGKEQPALGLDVLSPTRGRLHIYAEGNSAISTLTRADYFTFRVEVQLPVEGDPLDLAFTYAELRAWDERRYNSRAGSCWYANSSENSCSNGMEGLEAWSESAKSFISEPPASWYALAKDLRARTVRDRRKSR